MKKNRLIAATLSLSLAAAAPVFSQSAGGGYYVRGLAYAKRGEHAKGIEAFGKAIGLEPDNGVYYSGRGGAYYSLGEYERALAECEKAVRLSPGDAGCRECLAKSKAALGRPDPVPVANPITITFLSPRVSAQSAYTVRACVKSGGRTVDRVLVTVNGGAQRGISVSRDDGCDYSVNQTVSLSAGENAVKVDVTAGGVSSSGLFAVEYRSEAVATRAIDGRRAALVIGNADYKNAPLLNPVTDAKLVEAKLRSLGFDVTTVTDASNRAMKNAINEFAGKAKGAAIALFFYAGHGVQHNNTNYFLPVDIERIDRPSDVEDEGTSMDRVMNAMDDTRAQVKIVMLDACRNNVLMRGAGGLAAPGRNTEGTFIAYATSPGKTALDNSPFTKSFLKHVDTPGLKIEDLFKTVLTDVKKTTGGEQQPWTSSSLDGDFYFKK